MAKKLPFWGKLPKILDVDLNLMVKIWR